MHRHGTEKKQQYTFHPHEIAFCGYSNSGKTTLITRLIRDLSKEYKVGYFKHDVHSFSMDHEGKDTYRARESGAHAVFISDITHFAQIHSGSIEDAGAQYMFLNNDLLFVEGYKELPLPKIVVLDREEGILDIVERGELTRVIAFVGSTDRPARLPPEYPFFHRDDVSGIKQHILTYLKERIRHTPLYGLVLAGGKSSRMKRDKSSLVYHGRPQAEHCFDLLSLSCERVFLSNREEQSRNSGHRDLPQIHDAFLDVGPLGGILSAMVLHPGAAWLVVACDLPFISAETIETLIRRRHPFKVATAYQSAHDGLPEPLCAIYEPKGCARLLQFLGDGCTCPRKILIHSEIQLLQQSNRGSLDNVNDSEEYEGAVAFISKGGGGVSRVMTGKAFKQINVRYCALFREERGLNEETLETGASTARELYGHLKEKYHFSLPWESLRVAINDEFAGWEEPLNAGDELVFIPPVSGG